MKSIKFFIVPIFIILGATFSFSNVFPTVASEPLQVVDEQPSEIVVVDEQQPEIADSLKAVDEQPPEVDNSLPAVGDPQQSSISSVDNADFQPISATRLDTAAEPQHLALSENNDSNNPVDKLKKMQGANSDTIGWLVLDNTKINFPIMQTKDDDYYLNHDEYKNSTKSGAVFLDYQVSPDFINANNLIYAHNLNTPGKGFSELVKYKNRDFFDTHTAGWIYTPDKVYKLEIFSVYVTGASVDPYTWFPSSEDAFEQYLDEIKTNSIYYNDNDIKWGDHIVTFCTCSYEFENARTIVHAKMTEMQNEDLKL